MNIIYLDGQSEINREILMRLVANNAARGNNKLLENIKKYHLDDISRICDYIMSILGGSIIDARVLNACYHQALTELNIDSNKITKAMVTSNDVQVKQGLAM